MVITVYKPLEINRIYTEKDFGGPLEYLHKEYETYTFLVVREATLEEYRKQVRELYERPDLVQELGYYYDIQTD